MISYVAQETKEGFTAKTMLHLPGLPIKFMPTDCRTFKTFDEANKAARFMANQDGKIFVNMR